MGLASLAQLVCLRYLEPLFCAKDKYFRSISYIANVHAFSFSIIILARKMFPFIREQVSSFLIQGCPQSALARRSAAQLITKKFKKKKNLKKKKKNFFIFYILYFKKRKVEVESSASIKEGGDREDEENKEEDDRE